jgi:hypothetical protein
VCVGLIAVAATLESVFAVCLGCQIFAVLMHVGVIPASVCEECNDIWARGRAERGTDSATPSGSTRSASRSRRTA